MSAKIVIITCVLTYMISKYWIDKKYIKLITIKRKLNLYLWIPFYSQIFMLTIMMMVFQDWIVYEINKSLRFEGLIYLFVKNGGLIIFIMLISSLLYNIYIKSIGFEYFIECYQWIRKIFFSIVCISLIVVYLIAINESNSAMFLEENIVVWIIVCIEIWISFDFNIKMKRKKIKQKEEKNTLVICLLSMCVVPFMSIIYYKLMKKENFELFNNIFYSICFGACLGIILAGLISFYKYRLNEWQSIKIYNKVFLELQNESCIEYFMRIKYKLRKIEDRYILQVYEQEIKLENKNSFSKSYTDSVDDWFGEFREGYSLQEYDKDDIKESIKEKLLLIANKRKDLLKEGWNLEYSLYKERWCKEQNVDEIVAKTTALNTKINYKEVKDPLDMCTVLEEIREDGRTEGRLEGRAVEIIQMGREFNLSDDDILVCLQRKLEISSKEAKEYLDKFSK